MDRGRRCGHGRCEDWLCGVELQTVTSCVFMSHTCTTIERVCPLKHASFQLQKSVFYRGRMLCHQNVPLWLISRQFPEWQPLHTRLGTTYHGPQLSLDHTVPPIPWVCRILGLVNFRVCVLIRKLSALVTDKDAHVTADKIQKSGRPLSGAARS